MVDSVQIGGFGTIFLVDGSATGGAYALIEHTLEPGLLGAPPHRHSREDELSYVLEGTLTVWRQGQAVEHGPGSIVSKPRAEWHTFWNTGSSRVRFLEVISPPAFATYFRELATIIPAEGLPDPAEFIALAARYGLEYDFERMRELPQRHGLRLG